MKNFRFILLAILLLTSGYSQAQTIQIIECNVSVSPPTLRLAGNIPNVGSIDRIEEQLITGDLDTVQVGVYFDHCGPTGCCVPYDTTFVLEQDFPFYLCVNAYLDTFSVVFPCIATNDEIEFLHTQCLSADQILSDVSFLNQSQVKLFPNPASGNLNVDLTAFQKIPSFYLIRDLSGRLLKEGVLSKLAETVDVSELPSGVLILEMQFESGILRKRFVKVR